MTPPVPAHPALFLDVDGTLLPITTRPVDARPDRLLLEQLERLQAALGGAVALLSGRRLGAVTEMFAPLELAAAGTHGLERRSRGGDTVATSVDEDALIDVRAALVELLEAEPRLLMEDKGDAFAIHYRAAPELAPVVVRKLQEIARRGGPGFHVLSGLFVFEIKPRQPNKGSALLAFMAEAPFHGRTPVAVGDDLTDLDAFRAAESRGGMGIGVGDRIRARWQLADPAALRKWLDEVASASGG